MTHSYAHRSAKVRHEVQKLTEEPGFQRERVSGFSEAVSIILHLPFSNDDNLIRIIKNLQKFEGFHIVHICQKLLLPLKEVFGDQIALFQNESENLINLCYSYCVAVNTDCPRRMSLSEFSAVVLHAINHCYKSQSPGNLLSTFWVSNYLEFFKVLIVANVAENYEKSFQEASDTETVLLFTKCVSSFETRLRERNFIEILKVTVGFAELDGILKNYERSFGLFLESARPVANLLMEWIKLLQFPFVSNDFAIRLARIDELLNKRSEYAKRREETGYIPNFEGESFTYRIAGAIQYIKIENERFEFSQDQNKLDIFFKNYNSIHQYPVLSLKLLSSEHISSTEISDIFDLLGFKIIEKPFLIQEFLPSARNRSFWLLSQILLKLPVCRPLVTILRLWKTHFPADSQYIGLLCLLEFAWYPVEYFGRVEMEKHVHDLSEFLCRLPKDLLQNIHLWKDLFFCLIRGFDVRWNRFATDVFLIRFFIETLSCLDSETNHVLNCDKFRNLQALLQCLTRIAELNVDDFCKEKLIWLMFDFLTLVPAPALFNIVVRDLIPHLWYLLTTDAQDFVLTLIKGLKDGVIQLDSKDVSNLLASVSSIYDGNERALLHVKLLSFMKTYRDDKHSRSQLTLLQHCMQLNLPAKSKVLIVQTFSDSQRMRLFNFIPEWLLTQRGVSNARLEESFRILTAAIERTLAYNEQLCTTFRDQFTSSFKSVSSKDEVFNVLVAATAGALSASTFDAQIDPLCILALEDANDLEGYQFLSLYRHVRSGFLEVKHLMSEECVTKAQCNESLSVETGAMPEPGYNQDLIDLAKSLQLLISCPAQMLQKIRLVKTVFSLFVRLEIKPPNHLLGAITLIVPMSFEPKNSTPTTYTKFIMDCLNDSQLMMILGKIWEGSCKLHSEHTTSGESLSSVLARRFPEAFDNKDASKIYRCLSKFSEESPIVLCLLMFLVRQLLEQSSSLSTFFNTLENLEGILRNPGTTSSPVLLMCLREANRKRLGDGQVEMLTQTVSGGWVTECDLTLFSGLEIPQLLVAFFVEAVDVEERANLVQRIFQTLAKIPKELASRIISKVEMYPRFSKERSVLSLGFEWIIQSSSLSLTEIILALELCLDSLSLTSLPWLSCRSVSPIEAGKRILKCKPAGSSERDSIRATTKVDLPRPLKQSTTDLRVPESSGKSSEPEISEFLTPAVVAHDLIVMFRQLTNDYHCTEEQIELNVKHTFNYIFREPKGFTIGGCCLEEFQNVTEKVFSCLNRILTTSKSLEAPVFWLKLSHHHFVQCSEIILDSCKWYPAKGARPDEILTLQEKVISTLTLLNSRTDVTGSHWNRKCYQELKNEIDHISLILSMNIDLEMTATLLDLTVSDSQLSSTCAQIISVWTDELEKENLVQNLSNLHAPKGSSMAKDISFIHDLLVPAGRIFVNSVEDVLHARVELISIVELQEKSRLERFIPWVNEMLQSGVSCKAIDTWCTSFLFAEDTTSRDIDAICNLTMKAFEKIPSVYESVTRCLFAEDISERIWSVNRLIEDEFKRCLRLARLLNEFVTIAQQTTSVTSSQEGEVLRILAEACQKLCQQFLDNSSSSKKLYKIHHDTLVLLFYHIFCDKEEKLGSESTKSDQIEETVLRRFKDGKVFEVMLVIMRRWSTSIQKRPQLSSHVRNIVQIVMSENPMNTLVSKVSLSPPSSLQPGANVEEIIHCYVESLEGNQATVARLRTAHYNQVVPTTDAGTNDTLDLWRSPFIELSCYINSIERPETKKLAQNLRTLWGEWRDILNKANIKTVVVNNAKVEVKSLFKCTNNLQELEHQAEAVKEVTRELNSENFAYWRQHLLRREELQRRKFKKLCLYTQEEGVKTKTQGATKLVIVWENRFLESAKLCTEKIPGCYAPNGFHSEKPVLCGLRKDNKILTLFKEKKRGVREELENVEVRLYEAGMYVFGQHSDTHEFVTDELWAAFYQMLLQRKFVPTIILSNISPAFEWIKLFVKPDPGPPEPWGLNYYPSVVPPDEDDANDHDPKLLKHRMIFFPDLKEFMTLTEEKVATFKFSDLQTVKEVEEREERMRHLTKEVRENVLSLLGENFMICTKISEEDVRKLLKRLSYAINLTVRHYILDDNIATPEFVIDKIDMDKLHHDYADVLCGVGIEIYAEIITEAMSRLLPVVSRASSQP